MRVVAVSRILNEADIIEPFIRHHAALIDLHIVLDNGSTDGTVEILRELHGEGVPLQVYQNRSPLFLEQAFNTGLYRLALAEGADWVLFLDADELLVVRDAARPHEVLSLVPDGLTCLSVLAYNYARPAPEAGAHPFTALQRRVRTPEMPKVVVRRLEPGRVSIYAGNHYAFIDGREDFGLLQERLLIAHMPDRSQLQLARKAILARLKPIASGEAASGHFGMHQSPTFEALKQSPRVWLDAEVVPADLIDDPVQYLGGALRYTSPADEIARLIGILAVQTERLALSHGAILDAKRLIRRELLRKGAELTRLL